MSRIQVLDCTLRDGGYCNQWQFGFENIKKIANGLSEAGVDIIECGFLTNLVQYDKNVSKFNKVSQFSDVIPVNKEKLYVAMMNYGEYSIDSLPNYDGKSIDGIRVAFHKKNMREALALCNCIKNKGYLVFIQPMVSLSYSDDEFLNMIRIVNDLNPYAFYIVDSFGEMRRSDLVRLYFLVEHNLKEDIKIGFHSHNNMQLAFSNAQCLVDMHTHRELIIDSSVYGMGRGAGNLNSELLVDYLNECNFGKYELKPLLIIIDEILNEFYQKNYWGYSLPNYISASHHSHPNYASYLDDKKTLTVDNMNTIFDLMDNDKRFSFDKDYIEELYLRFMESGVTHEEHRKELEKILRAKSVLLIAAGKSSVDEKKKIVEFSNNKNVVSISVNYNYPYLNTNYIFLSNLRRYRELAPSDRCRCITTNNIPSDDVYLQTGYRELLSDGDVFKDNAGMMVIKFLLGFSVKEIYLAGYDGYSYNSNENFAEDKMSVVMKKDVVDTLNESMVRTLRKYSEKTRIRFLTTPKYITLD